MATAIGQLKPDPLDATCRKKERKKSLLPQVIGESRCYNYENIVTCKTACILHKHFLLWTVLLAQNIDQQEEKGGTANNA